MNIWQWIAFKCVVMPLLNSISKRIEKQDPLKNFMNKNHFEQKKMQIQREINNEKVDVITRCIMKLEDK